MKCKVCSYVFDSWHWAVYVRGACRCPGCYRFYNKESK